MFLLQPGKELKSDPLLIFSSPDPLGILEAYGEAVHEHESTPILDHPVVVWTGYYGSNYYGECSDQQTMEQIVNENIAWFRDKHPEFFHYGLRYIWFTVGCQQDDLMGNWLEENFERFPAGLENMARIMQEPWPRPRILAATGDDHRGNLRAQRASRVDPAGRKGEKAELDMADALWKVATRS